MPDVVNLLVLEGPHSGEVFEIGDAERTVVGRSRTASIRIDTPGLSREHFEIWRAGSDWMIRDLDSRNGLAVNRRPVHETILLSGDEIQAGDTRYRIEMRPPRRRLLEDVSEPRPADAAPASPGESGDDQAGTLIMPLPVYEHVHPTLRPEKPQLPDGTLLASLVAACLEPSHGRVFALIDGAQAFEVAFTARLMGNRLYTLFSGKLAVDLAHVGPCLIELPSPEPFLAKWIEVIGGNAGVLFQSGADLTTIYRHLRSLFIASDEGGREYFFRFYDPRVLRVFLPTCTAAELTEFFGPLATWVTEQDGAREYVRYTIGANGLETSILTGS